MTEHTLRQPLTSSRRGERFSRQNERNFWLFQIILVLLFCSWFAYWAYKVPYNKAPDEMMRYLIPSYIYNHLSLPSGYDAEAIYVLGNWSYAFYPQMLGAIISAFFMHVMNLFYSTDASLLWAARLTSVMFGGMTVFFTGRSLYRLTEKKLVSCLGMVLLAFLPQFTYLSCYVNNDIIATAGASIIVYTMILATSAGWHYQHSLGLSAGFIICGLGYLNAYGFILIGGLFFLLLNYLNIKNGSTAPSSFKKNFWLIFILSACAIFPFLIRNVLLYQDIFGTRVFREEYLKWLETEGARILQHPYQERDSLVALLRDGEFFKTTLRSFIGYFDYMSIPLKDAYYYFYYWIGGSGLTVFLLTSLRKSWRREITVKKLAAFGLILTGCLITIGLQLYYTYFIDYQPQGRYIMAIISPLIIVVALGGHYGGQLLPRPVRNSLYLLLALSYIICNYLVYQNFLSLTWS